DSGWKEIVKRENKLREAIPKEIKATLLDIDEQRKAKGSAWLPQKIEVMFWPYEYAPEESIVWPKDWPGLFAKDTRKRHEDSCSVYLDSEKLSKLRHFLSTEKNKGAVSIDGKKMATAYRYPFPWE